MTKVLVLGLDGADWNMLTPWLDDGTLPSLRVIRDSGVYGPLQSVLPPVTCPAWRCYASGKNPGKLGVYWWAAIDHQTGQVTTPNAHSFKSLSLWDYLGDAGYRVAVINMPTTYPPTPVNGIMVSGFGAPMEKTFDWKQAFTYPPELQKELERRWNYQVGLEAVIKEDRSQLLAAITRLINMRFDLLGELMDQGGYDFIHLTIFYINLLQHFYGISPEVKEAWQLVDDRIGQVLDQGYTIWIMSDHGSVSIDIVLAINAWLRQEGYLEVNEDFGDLLAQRAPAALELIYRLRGSTLAQIAQRLLPLGFISRIPDRYGFVGTGLIDLKVDWRRSKAVGLSQGPIYINPNNVDDCGAFVDELTSKLMKLRHPATGEQLVQAVFRRDEVYKGAHLENAPDLVLLPAEVCDIYGGLGNRVLLPERRGWQNGNRYYGVFVVYGEDFKTGYVVDMSILDIAPTVLHTFQVPIPEDIDGRVRADLLHPDSEIAQMPVAYQQARSRDEVLTETEEAELRRRLQDLGYLG